jgi:hypothetical protein
MMPHGMFGIYSRKISCPPFLFDVTVTFLIVFIDSMNVLFFYVDKEGEIWTVSFSSTNGQVKKMTTNKVMALLCLGP